MSQKRGECESALEAGEERRGYRQMREEVERRGRKQQRRLCKNQCGIPLRSLSVCQCMCLIGFPPNWHVFKRNLRGLIKPDSVEAW